MTTVSILDESKIKNIFDQQTDLAKIVDYEQRRLETQKKTIDSASHSQHRLMSLNDAFRKRYNDYLKIFVIILITTIVIFGIILLRENFPFIPSIIIDIILSIVIAIALILIILILYNLYNRDMTDYDKLADAGWYFGSGSGLGIAIGSGSGFGNHIIDGVSAANTCVDEACCGFGSKWCKNSNVCISQAQWAASCSDNANYSEFKP